MEVTLSVRWSAPVRWSLLAQLQCQCRCQWHEKRAFIRLHLKKTPTSAGASCRDMADGPGRSPSRDRANGEEEKRRRSPDEPPRPDGDFKIFVGGISWHMNDRGAEGQ